MVSRHTALSHRLVAAAGACALVRRMNDLGKPIGAICHAAHVLISARIVEGRTLTSYESVKDDLENARATWVNRDVVGHTATATGRPRWETALLAPGDTGRVVATVAGTAPYVCALHPTMHGVLVIR